MKNDSSYTLIYIGLEIRVLRNLSENTSVDFALRNINRLIEELENSGFSVSIAGMNKIRNFRKQIEELETSSSLNQLATEINDEMKLVEKIVFAEAMTKSVYTFPERRFNSEFLLNEPARLLKAGAFDKLSEIAQSDISAASRCILFGEATAAAFHILRASEETLRLYYFVHKKRNRLENPMWGPMTNELKAKTRNKPPKVVLDSLDLVRKSYRNPTQHPEAKYDIEGAQDLLGVCLDLIGKMASEL